MIESKELINAVLSLVVAAIALVPITIFYKSYRVVRGRKLLMTLAAFLLFFIEAVILGARPFIPGASAEVWYLDDEFWWSAASIMDVMILGLFTMSLTSKT